jgi:hypothetical protein
MYDSPHKSISITFVINYGGEISGPHGGEYEDDRF